MTENSDGGVETQRSAAGQDANLWPLQQVKASARRTAALPNEPMVASHPVFLLLLLSDKIVPSNASLFSTPCLTV